MKHLALAIAIAFLLSGCSLTKQAPTQSKNTFTFDYVPKKSNSGGTAGMVLALFRPYYPATFGSENTELFKNFKASLSNDIEELIIARGFTMKGPYESFDEMIFEDKKRTDVAIKIDIALAFTAAEGNWKSHFSLLGSNYTSYSYSGKVSMIGKINLTGLEPLTNEKIWSKSVLIPNVENIQIATSEKHSEPLTGDDILKDPGVFNAIGKALKEQYEGILSKIEAHFSPEEFGSLKAQIKELKSKKGF